MGGQIKIAALAAAALMVGNSVPPPLARAVLEATFGAPEIERAAA